MIRRFAVLDADGVKVNCILIDDKSVDKYWPGYGAKLLDEGPESAEPRPQVPPSRPDDFGVLDVIPSEPMQTGDRIDFRTGIVTRRLSDPVVVDNAPGEIDAD